MAVSLEMINPFLKSAVSVLDQMIGEKAQKSEVKMQKTNFVSEGFSVLIGIAEGGKGIFLIDMPIDVAIKISEIVNEEKYDGLDDFVFITMSEIANMISGQGISEINNLKKGLNLRLTPPSVFSGEGLEINSPKLDALGIKFKLSFGEISLNIAFERLGD